METTYPAAAATVSGDTIARLSLAQAEDTDSQTLWQLIDDQNITVANTARSRLGLVFRPLTEPAGPKE
ncbi:hypothetical protein [Pseudarthrobacter sp. BIM B-2242]|uniref:hypothetical protein n=1 Tax=Pseudarthrobacter sp. BIM B-2242 TaxID=2772401 RepID=UPI00168BD1F0|nr:hypothetical protein [Pseudarthrobacter sp. BIM B-2242]QOD05693.1 hypothetical protein IDT60_21865 [Pseudarthrobacter sp. BIM B-2242]